METLALILGSIFLFLPFTFFLLFSWAMVLNWLYRVRFKA